MKMKQLRVNLGANSYDITIERGLLRQIGPMLRQVADCRRAFVLTDEQVGALYGGRVTRSLEQAGYKVQMLALPAGESTKSLSSLGGVYQALLDFHMTRTDVILTLGGGVIGDLGGFAAATFLRGVPFVQIPTSLLAQVDSSVGGKVAVDLPGGKNLVGSFYQPKAVFIDPDVLGRLSDHFWSDGLGEVIKYGCILDEGLFELLESMPSRPALMERMDEVVYRCCDLKRALVQQDEHDTGLRMLLNFGHTLGHAIEAAQQYQGLSHGQAVALGMHLITRLSEEKGMTMPGTLARLDALLHQHDLPTAVRLEHPERIMSAIGNDKKNLGGKLSVVLIDRIGQARLYATTPDFFKGVETWIG
jgi:3-dehydroquinate synthase